MADRLSDVDKELLKKPDNRLSRILGDAGRLSDFDIKHAKKLSPKVTDRLSDVDKQQLKNKAGGRLSDADIKKIKKLSPKVTDTKKQLKKKKDALDDFLNKEKERGF